MKTSDSSFSRLLFGSRFAQILWLLSTGVIFFLYYRWQTPLRMVATNLVPVPLAFLHVCALTGLGWPLSRLLIKQQDKWIEALLSFGFGMGLTGIFTFSLGLMGNFDPLLFVVWEIAGLSIFVFAVYRRRPYKLESIQWNIWNITGGIILFFFIVVGIPFLVSPEISTDAISYHLLIPRLYLLRGEVYHIPLLVEAYYPSLAEYNYLPLLALADEIVCKSFHFWGGLAVLILMTRIVKCACAENKNKLLAPALFLSMPVTAIHIAWAWNDFFYTLYVLLSLYFLLLYHLSEEKSGRDLFIAGLMAGLSSWMKYTFVLFFFTSLLLFLIGFRKWKWNWRHFYLFALGFCLVALFWMFQNWTFTENPFYPFLHRIFPGPHWNEHVDQYFHDFLRKYEIQDWNWKTYFTFPIPVVLKPRLVDNQTGILPLVLAPLLFLKNQAKGVRLLKAYVAACLFVWIFIQTENRSILTVFSLIFCIASISLEKFPWTGKHFKHITAGVILAAAATNFFYTSLTAFSLFDPVRYFLGRESKAQYITRLSESQQAFDFVNGLPEAGRVLLVSSHVPYYVQKPYFFSSFADPPIAEVLSREAKSAGEIAIRFKNLGITHVILNRPAYDKENRKQLYSWSNAQRLRFEEFLLKHCTPVIKYGSDYVFRINR